MAKFLIINHPKPAPVRRERLSGCVSHFVNLDRAGKARVWPIAGLKGYATLVDVESHEALGEILSGNPMRDIEEYQVIALSELTE